MPPTLMCAIERDVLLAQALLRLRDQRRASGRSRRPTPASGSGCGRCRSATRAGSRGAGCGTAAARRGRSAPRAARARDSARRARGRRVLPSPCRRRGRTCGSTTGLPSIPSATAPVRLELLVLRRQPVAVEEQELGAEQADAGRAGCRAVCARSSGSSMFAYSSMRRPSSVSAGFVRRRLSFCALELELALLQPVLGEHRPVRIDDDDAVVRRRRSASRRRGSARARCASRPPPAR